MEDYASKTIVITGGTSGLGLALARILGKRGAHIVITGRRTEKGDAAVATLSEENIEAKFIHLRGRFVSSICFRRFSFP